MMKLFVAFAFLALNLYTYYFLASEAVIPPRTSFEHFPGGVQQRQGHVHRDFLPAPGNLLVRAADDRVDRRIVDYADLFVKEG